MASLEPRKEAMECLPNLDLFLEVGEMIFSEGGKRSNLKGRTICGSSSLHGF